MRDQALAQAKMLGEEQKAGRIRSPLHGIPIGVKDNIDTAGVRTTAASAVFEDRVPAEDSEVVRRAKGGRRCPNRKVQSARIRAGRDLGNQFLWSGSKPLEAGAECRRLI
jgi:hypothetical protein